MTFPCKACGECCRQLESVPALNRGDGVCKHFDESSSLCTVYARRPVVCRVDAGFAAMAAEGMGATVYYMTQAAACAVLIPDNTDMPQRTEAALRAAQLFDEDAVYDTHEVAHRVTETMTKQDMVRDSVLPHSPECAAALPESQDGEDAR